MVEAPHTVKSYEEELKNLNSNIIKMGGFCEESLGKAIQAITTRNSDNAEAVIKDDEKIDKFETLIEQQVVNLIALRQPMAIDLRETVTALKISSDLERINTVPLYFPLERPVLLTFTVQNDSLFAEPRSRLRFIQLTSEEIDHSSRPPPIFLIEKSQVRIERYPLYERVNEKIIEESNQFNLVPYEQTRLISGSTSNVKALQTVDQIIRSPSLDKVYCWNMSLLQ